MMSKSKTAKTLFAHCLDASVTGYGNIKKKNQISLSFASWQSVLQITSKEKSTYNFKRKTL